MFLELYAITRLALEGAYRGSLRMGLAIYLFYWERHRSEEMSRKKIHAKRRREREIIGDVVSEAIEEAVKVGRITREGADFWYWRMRFIGLHGLGNEPTLGVPWWEPDAKQYGVYKPVIPHPAAVKYSIKDRIENWAVKLSLFRERRPKVRYRPIPAKHIREQV